MATKTKEVARTDAEMLEALTNQFDEACKFVGPKIAEQHLLDLLLRVDGYFQDEFTAEEIVRMKYNIASDFPIFLETRIGNMEHEILSVNNECRGHLAHIHTLETAINDREEEVHLLKEKNRAILVDLLDAKAEFTGDKVENALGKFNIIEVITEKLAQGIKLTDEEFKVVRGRLS